MIVAIALVTGFKKEITEKMFDFWGHIVITDTEINQSYTPMPIESGKMQIDLIKKISGEDLKSYRDNGVLPNVQKSNREPLVRHVQNFILLPGIIQVNRDYEGIQLKGIGSDFNPTFYDKYLVEGSPLSFSPDSISRDVMISLQTANRLQLKVGDPLIIYFVLNGNQITRRLTVSGIYKTGLEEYDKKVAFLDIKVLQQILKWEPQQSAGIEFFLNEIQYLDDFSHLILSEYVPLEYYAISIKHRFPSIFEWLELQDYNQYVILGLMLLVCIFNLITTSLILILERTRMIGILKTLGMSNAPLRKVFVYFSFKILLISMLIGNGIGLMLCFLQKQFHLIKLNEADYYLSEAPIHFAWTTFLWINVLIMIVVFIFLLLPSTLVQRISPVKAIRLK